MKVQFPLIFVSFLLSISSPPATAQLAGSCQVGPGLAATLLYPHVEVDLIDPNGVTTLLSINNGVDANTLARVVLWSDFGVPVLAFDLFLEPFDIQTINARSLLDGTLPSTGEGIDLGAFPFCNFLPPSHVNPVLSVDQVAQLRADLTGIPGPLFDDCVGSSTGDGVARGYVTVDVIDECSGIETQTFQFTPASTDPDIPYFDDGGGAFLALNENRLWGDVVYVDFTGAAAQGSEAVAVFANEETFAGPDIFTFYGRFSNWDGRDHRVPLPSLWNQRYLNGGPFQGGADLVVWRDPGAPTGPVDCGMQAAPFPLADETFIGDEEANLVAAVSNDNFPLATQRVSIDDLGAPFDFGWLQIDVGETSQAWVQPSLNASGLFSASLNGVPAAFLCGLSPEVAQDGEPAAVQTPATRSLTRRPAVQ